MGHLGAMLAHLGGYVGPSWGYLGPCWGRCCPMLGLCWPILRPMLAHVGPSSAIRSEKWQKMGRAQNTVKRGGFWRYRRVGGRGRGPSLLRRGENCRTARTRPGGPWPDLSAYARQPARGPTMWAHFVAMLAYVGVCWPILRAMWAHLGAMLAHLGAMLAQLGAMVAHLGAMLAHLGAMLAHLRAMLAHLEAYVGPS